MTAYAYLRKSVVRLDDPHNSAEAQEAAVRAMAARYGDAAGLVLLSDWNVSGKLGRERRPGYAALWQAIESGRCSALYSYSMSRLARSVSELTRLFEACAERKIPVRLEADTVDTSTASGRMTATILASVAAFESDVAGERMRSALAAKLARGERIGSQPYGAKPGQDSALVLATFREVRSYGATARRLNLLEVKPRNGKSWHASSVQQVVTRLDPSIGTHPRKGSPAGGMAYRLAGLLGCGTCGNTLTPMTTEGRIRYVCQGRNRMPHPRVTVTEHLIIDAVKAEVAHLRTPGRVERQVGDEAKRAALDARRLRVIDMYEAGVIDRADRDRRLAIVSEALGKLEAQRAVLDVPPPDWSDPPATINRVLRLIFTRIDLDAQTFQPLPDGFHWAVARMRAR